MEDERREGGEDADAEGDREVVVARLVVNGVNGPEQRRGVLEPVLHVIDEIEEEERDEVAFGRALGELVRHERGDAGEGGEEGAAEEELREQEEDADPGVGERLSDAAGAADPGADVARGEEHWRGSGRGDRERERRRAARCHELILTLARRIQPPSLGVRPSGPGRPG